MEAAFALATGIFLFLAQAEGLQRAPIEHMDPKLPGTVRGPVPMLLLGPGRGNVPVANEIAASMRKDACGCSERHTFFAEAVFR